MEAGPPGGTYFARIEPAGKPVRLVSGLVRASISPQSTRLLGP